MPSKPRKRLRDSAIIGYRKEQLERQADGKRIKRAPLSYDEVTDDEDDGCFPHRLHPHCTLKQLTDEKKEELREHGFKIREGDLR